MKAITSLLTFLMIANASFASASGKAKRANREKIAKHKEIERAIKGINDLVKNAPSKRFLFKEMVLDGTDSQSGKPCLLMIHLDVFAEENGRSEATASIQLSQRATNSVYATGVGGSFNSQGKMVKALKREAVGVVIATIDQISIQRIDNTAKIDETIVLISETDATTETRKIVRAVGIDAAKSKSLSCTFGDAN